jgi:hypothetical protein
MASDRSIDAEMATLSDATGVWIVSIIDKFGVAGTAGQFTASRIAYSFQSTDLRRLWKVRRGFVKAPESTFTNSSARCSFVPTAGCGGCCSG